MPELEVDCPHCGATSGTGITLSELGFEAQDFQGRRTDCDSCGETIEWDKADVVNM